MEKKKIIRILFVLLGLLYIIFLYFCMNVLSSIENNYSRYETFEYYSNEFSKDPIILDISNICKDSVNPVRCVFNLVPMNYDYGRVEYSESDFRNPEDYFIFGGVCRDATVLRASALDNLGIVCMFDFSEANHVFLVCVYESEVYTLNNGLFY